MSERERLLPTGDSEALRAGSAVDPAGTSTPIASSENLASLDARRRATTRKFVAQTVSLLCACAAILSCHAQLASVQFGSRDRPSADPAAGAEASGRLDPAAQELLASEVVAAAGTPKDAPFSGRYPSWWNDTRSLPDAQPIFIHIPKTGGVSVEDTASKAGHVTGACVVHAFGDEHLPYAVAPGFDCEPYHTPPLRFVPFSFAVVRDPYARMVSEFNWRAMWDERVAEEMRGGKWSFTCDDFEDAVRDHVAQVAENPFFACLSETDFEEADYASCHAKHPNDPLTDSHAFPQWLFAKNAERVFKYEAFEAEVWPFLRRAGVVRARDGAEKINSAGAVSEVASKCWAFMSRETLEDFVRLYAVDFKNLGYDPTDFGKDAAAAAAGAAAALGAAREGRLTVDVRAMIDRAASANLGLTERNKAVARGSVISVDVNVEERATLARAGAPAGAAGSLGAAGGATPTCVSADRVTALGDGDDARKRNAPGRASRASGASAEWVPAGWAVAEGTLRRATFAAQRVSAALAAGEWFEHAATSEEDMAGMGGATGAVAKARAVRRRERGAHGGCREGIARLRRRLRRPGTARGTLRLGGAPGTAGGVHRLGEGGAAVRARHGASGVRAPAVGRAGGARERVGVTLRAQSRRRGDDTQAVRTGSGRFEPLIRSGAEMGSSTAPRVARLRRSTVRKESPYSRTASLGLVFRLSP